MANLSDKKLLELASKKEYWKTHPEDFMKEMLDFELPIHQKKILKNIVKYNKVAIASSNGIGKSKLLSALAVWFFFCYLETDRRSNCIVVFTAPTFEQVRVNIYNNVKEFIKTADDKLKEDFDDETLSLFGKLSDDKNRAEIIFNELSYMVGVTGSGENKVVGKHGQYVLVIYDEAQGIENGTFSDFNGITLSGDVIKQVMIGNTTLPEEKGNFGKFYEAFSEKSSYHKMQVSCFDTHTFLEIGIKLEDYLVDESDETYWRNKLDRWASKKLNKKISYYDYKKTDDLAMWEREVKNAMAPWGKFLINPIAVYDILVECGYNPNAYEFLTRCLAKFPVGMTRGLIPQNWIANSIQNYNNNDFWIQGDVVMGVDVGGGSGADDSAISIRNGNKIIYCEKFNLETFELVDKIHEIFLEFDCDRIQIEKDGIGKDKYLLLEKLKLPVVGIQSGGSAGVQDDTWLFDKKANDELKKRFNRKRDELWSNLRDYLNPLRVQVEGVLPILLPNDEDLKKELPAITYNDTGKFKVTPKDDLRKILKGSPNKADSVIFAFAECGEAFSTKYKFGAFNISSGIDRNSI